MLINKSRATPPPPDRYVTHRELKVILKEELKPFVTKDDLRKALEPYVTKK
ncbi:hypothetical protein FACS1894166_12890 [Bacilli bacterium]|nr:hypothetical protein FACS1894166_12890 [Bacilli bacterium]